jgi:hypothetical protein
MFSDKIISAVATCPKFSQLFIGVEVRGNFRISTASAIFRREKNNMHFRLETEGTKTYKVGLFCLNEGCANWGTIPVHK